MPTKINIHRLDLDARREYFKQKFPPYFKDVFEFMRLASIGQINKGKKISEVRRRKYLDMLTIFFSNISQPLSKFSKRDMENFIQNLETDKILKHNKRVYSENTKQDVKLVLRAFIEWRFPKKSSEMTSWFDTKIKKTTPEVLSEEDVETLFNSCKSEEERLIICLLFDGGFRAEELLNIRFGDVEKPTESFPYYKITVREEYSKTEGRNIGLYWKNTTEALNKYLSEIKDKSRDNQLINRTYDSLRFFISRLGKQVLKRRVHLHLFRKTSATYYASKLNRQQLCVRFGWKFSSDMPDVYIKRAGVEEEQIKEKMIHTDLEKLQKENQELKTIVAIVKEENQKTAKGFVDLANQFLKLEKKMNTPKK